MASRYHGADGDLRSLYRKGSGLTLRRLSVLVAHLPYDAPLWPALEAAEKAAQKPTAERIRDRANYYANKGRASG